jgi:hypothetical protein
MLIGFLGKRGRGKDTCGGYLIEKHNFKSCSFALAIKKSVAVKYGLTYEQLNTDAKEVKHPYWNVTLRQIMQFEGDLMRKHGNELIPDINDNFFVKCVEKFIIENKQQNIVITDCRYQNEIDLIHKYKGIVIKITRDNIPESKQDSHSSEQSIDLIKDFDYEIQNNGTKQELYDKITFLLTAKSLTFYI